MRHLTPDQFSAFFGELYRDPEGKPLSPFPWQQRLAEQVCNGTWPDYLAAPTASGKTACVDIALFALAFQADWPADRRTAPRRVFFVVDRRVIVDEVYRRAKRLEEKFANAGQDMPTVRRVAELLRQVAGNINGSPLFCCQLRGGVYRDNAWIRSPAQPTVIVSTVDQVGSRVLFRGYGVSESTRPIHAGLIGNDALIILDEAHCARPFSQTLAAVGRYRGPDWASEPLPAPFAVVQMTATPPPDAEKQPGVAVFRLDRKDKDCPTLHDRLFAQKPARLVVAKPPKGMDAQEKLVEQLVAEAVQIERDGAKTIAVIVNRVPTARKVAEHLKQRNETVELVIGRMRPIDRDAITKRLTELVGSDAKRSPDAGSLFVVATQCLEVGADYDFDGLVSECASIDALRQRFGRLNRLGRLVQARGCILIRGDQIRTDEQLERLDRDGDLADPIYGNALARTWNWLWEHSQVEKQGKRELRIADMGIASAGSVGEKLDGLRRLAAEDERARIQFDRLHPPAPDAPVMLPAHVDCWCQTCPVPMPDPDVSVFLHGPKRGEPEVQVVWRSDLEPLEDTKEQERQWTEIVSLCPPSSAECLSVPISVFRRWLVGDPAANATLADVIGGEPAQEGEESWIPKDRRPLAWRGPVKSRLVGRADQVQPGETLILPWCAGGRETLGHLPEGFGDRADEAFLTARDKLCLRLHPKLVGAWPSQGENVQRLLRLVSKVNEVPDLDSVREALAQYAGDLKRSSEGDLWLQEVLERLRSFPKRDLRLLPYPASGDGEDPRRIPGVVLQSKRRFGLKTDASLEEDADTDELSGTVRVPLLDHSENVRAAATALATQLRLPALAAEFDAAAQLHDLGKIDPRFQALLLGGDPLAARFMPRPLAKGDVAFSTAQYLRQCRRCALPRDFRHELLSVQVAEGIGALPNDPLRRALVLHLIASHHGRCRPFAPVIADDDPPELHLGPPVAERELHWSGDDRRQLVPAHRLDSGIPERFWTLVRHFGWWGLAYVEAALRLADWKASEEEQPPQAANQPKERPKEVT